MMDVFMVVTLVVCFSLIGGLIHWCSKQVEKKD